MTQQTIKLDKAVEVRERLDREIHENYQILVKENSYKENSEHVNAEQLLKDIELKEVQVIRLKEAIQKANLKTSLLERFSNSYYIYRLSQLKIKRDYLTKMNARKKAGKKIQITKNTAEDMIIKIEKEISKISVKLQKFNAKNNIKVKFEEELLYLLK